MSDDKLKALEGLTHAASPETRTADNIGRPPDVLGEHGCAWMVDLPRLRETRVDPDDDTGKWNVAAWVIEAPWAHRVWHSYLLDLIHLRCEVGRPGPSIAQLGATHEFVLFALDPDHDRGPFVRGEDVPHVLIPPNFGAQLTLGNDAAALELMSKTVERICAGTLSPDTDFSAVWVRIFGDSLMRKVQDPKQSRIIRPGRPH